MLLREVAHRTSPKMVPIFSVMMYTALNSGLDSEGDWENNTVIAEAAQVFSQPFHIAGRSYPATRGTSTYSSTHTKHIQPKHI